MIYDHLTAEEEENRKPSPWRAIAKRIRRDHERRNRSRVCRENLGQKSLR